ncbi:hypothetical protein P4562_07240 [Lysinibacillus xylanilyticus]|uniref:hypothetical protein n=1 Tax=Lysinibacillus xylanilyticus TaxID=582475 RepID=UPI002E24EAF4|nr:hypothetical protein [Lysinibacillus xylanilyticus]
MAGIIGHTAVTTTAALAYRKKLNIATLFAGMAFPDIITKSGVIEPLPLIGNLDESFIGGLICAVFLSLIIMFCLKTVPKIMFLFSYKQGISYKVIFISALVGTELHVLMDLIAINGWLKGTIL